MADRKIPADIRKLSFEDALAEMEEIVQSLESGQVKLDEAIDAGVRQNAESCYHPSCSCKMGGDNDPLAVLDSQCRVRGIDSLRVIDSSVFPTITNGNINAPTIMLAEKAADIIAAKTPLDPIDVPVYVAEDYRDQQR